MGRQFNGWFNRENTVPQLLCVCEILCSYTCIQWCEKSIMHKKQ